MNHSHAYFRLRFPRLVELLVFLGLPYGWLIESGELPHSPECTAETGVLIVE